MGFYGTYIVMLEAPRPDHYELILYKKTGKVKVDLCFSLLLCAHM